MEKNPKLIAAYANLNAQTQSMAHSIAMKSGLLFSAFAAPLFILSLSLSAKPLFLVGIACVIAAIVFFLIGLFNYKHYYMKGAFAGANSSEKYPVPSSAPNWVYLGYCENHMKTREALSGYSAMPTFLESEV